MRLLIVDGSVLIIERWQQTLTELEIVTAVYGAVSYKDGIRLFEEIKPDVVLLDSSLPAKEWIHLSKEIKKRNFKTIQIIFANPYDELLIKECKTLEADYIFDKYHDFEKIPVLLSTLSQKNK